MHVKNITKNYRLLNILIGEYYVTTSVVFLTKKEYFNFQVKKCHNLKVNFVTLIKYTFELKVAIMILRAV